MQLPEWIKPGVYGAATGAAAIAVVGFAAGWVVTASSAERLADQRAQSAAISALTPVCVAQFLTAPEAERTRELAALTETRSWSRSEYVADKGWATMPGAESPDRKVADACAARLMDLAKA